MSARAVRRRAVVEPEWAGIISPAAAVLRFGVLLAVCAGGAAGFHVQPQVTAVAVGLGLLYAVAHAAVAGGRLSAAALAYTVAGDALLLGVLLSGAGRHSGTVAFLALPILAAAQMSGGARLALLAGLGLGAGALFGGLAHVGPLVWVAAPVPAAFHTALEVETGFHGNPVAGSPAVSAPTLSLAMLLLIAAGGGVALIRAAAERRRAGRACARAEALEAIVDAFAARAPEAEFWQVVARSGAVVSGARVYVAVVDGDDVVVRAPAGPVAGTEAERTAEWILRNLRVPLAAQENLLVRSIQGRHEEECTGLVDLCRGADRAVAGDVLDRLGTDWPAAFVSIPIGEPDSTGAIFAAAPRITDAMREGLRAVAARTTMVRHAWRDRDAAPPEEIGPC